MIGLGTLLVSLSSVVTAAWAAPPPPPPPPTPEESFELGFNTGQAQYESGAFLEAARTWVEAASRVPEVTANRENRAALFDYIADAYLRGLPAKGRGPVLREAIAVLDGYCDGFLRAYGVEAPISAKVLQIQAELRRQLAAQPAPAGAIEPSWTPVQATRPWKGLVIGGAVLAGVGVGASILAGVMGARGNSLEAEFETAKCSLFTPTASCAELTDRGRVANSLAIGGAIVAPLALGGGVTMLIMGGRRRAAGRPALVPVLTPTFAGVALRWEGGSGRRWLWSPAFGAEFSGGAHCSGDGPSSEAGQRWRIPFRTPRTCKGNSRR